MTSSEVDELVQRWPLIQEFNLPEDSICLVIGAYKGLVMQSLYEIYRPFRIIGFEPQLWAFDQAIRRTASIPACQVYPWGLGAAQQGRFEMTAFETDECSFVGLGPDERGIRSKQRGEGYLVDARNVLEILNIWRADLAVINIEGYEYRLLPYLIEKKLHTRFDRLAVQFHTAFGTEEEEKRIFRLLSTDYTIEHNDYPSWVYWRAK